MRRGLLAVVLGVGGCPSDDGGVAATDTDTDTDSLTTFGPTTDDPEPTPDPSDTQDDDDESNTTAMSESMSGGGTSTGVAESSTGCTAGSLGCACDGGECDGALACEGDICVEPLCPDKEHEDNDAFNDAFDLGDYSDGDDPDNFTSALSGTDDVDWFRYGCTDTLLEEVDPNLISDTGMPMRVCMYLECVQGGNALFDCPEGTTAEQAPVGFIPGCCVDDSSTINLSDFNCPDSSDESLDVYIKAEMAQDNVCVAYSMTYNC